MNTTFGLSASDMGDMRYITITGIGYMASYKGRLPILTLNQTTHLTSEHLALLCQMSKDFSGFYDAVRHMNETGDEIYAPSEKLPATERHYEHD